MAIKIKPEDAKNYACCSLIQPCQGKSCMAWVDEMVIDRDKITLNQVCYSPHSIETIPTGLGYCGLSKH